MTNDVLVNDTGVYVGKAYIRIVEFGQVVLMYGLQELILEALCHCLESVLHLFCCFVADEEFAPSLGGCIGGNVIRVLSQVEGWLEEIIKVLDVEHFWHHHA